MFLLGLLLAVAQIISAEITVLKSNQIVYDKSPKLRIRGGFDAQDHDILLEISANGSPALIVDKDFLISKDADGDGLILNLFGNRRWVDMDDRTPPVSMVLNAVRFAADPKKNILRDPVIVGQVLNTTTVRESSDIIYQSATNELLINGTGFIGAKKVDFYFKPPLVKEVAYEDITPYPLVRDQIVLRVCHNYQWREEPGTLSIIGVDTGGAVEGVKIAEVQANLDFHGAAADAAATTQLLYADEANLIITGSGFNPVENTLRFANGILGQGINFTTVSSSETESNLRLVPGSFWRKNFENLPTPLTLFAVNAGQEFVAVGPTNSGEGRDIAMIFGCPQVFSSNKKLFRSHSHELHISGTGFPEPPSPYKVQLKFNPPLIEGTDYTLRVAERKDLEITLLDGRAWRSDPGPLIITQINVRGGDGGWVALPGDGAHVVKVSEDVDAVQTGGVEVIPMGIKVYQSALQETIPITGTGFKDGMSFTFDAALKAGTDYELTVQSKNKALLKLKEAGKKWRPDAGFIVVKSVKIESMKYPLAGSEGIRVTVVLVDLVITASTDNYHDSQAKLVSISGSGFTTAQNSNFVLRPSSTGTFKILGVLDDAIRLQFNPDQAWLPSYMTLSNEDEWKLTLLPVVRVDYDAGEIVFGEPIAIGTIVKDRDGVVYDSCEFALDGICDDGSEPNDQYSYDNQDVDLGEFYGEPDDTDGDDEAYGGVAYDDYYIPNEDNQVPPCVEGTDCRDCGGVDVDSDYITCIHPRDGVCDDLRGTLKYISVIALVSEYQSTTWTRFLFNLHILVLLAPVGLFLLFSNVTDGHDILVVAMSGVKQQSCDVNKRRMHSEHSNHNNQECHCSDHHGSVHHHGVTSLKMISYMRRFLRRQLMGCILLLFSVLGEVSSFQVHNTFSRRPTPSLHSSRMSPSRLLAARKWISLSPDDGALPLLFSIKLDDSLEIVDDLKEAIKKKAPDVLHDVSAAKLQLEYPSGTVLAPNSLPILNIKGGDTEEDPIYARLPQTGPAFDPLAPDNYLISARLSDLEAFFADVLAGQVKHFLFPPDKGIIKAYLSPSKFPCSLFTRQEFMSAPHVYLSRNDQINTYRVSATIEKVFAGKLVAWVGPAGAGKSQGINELFEAGVKELVKKDGKLKMLFFRIDDDLFMTYLDTTAPQMKDGSHKVKVEHIPNCRTFESQVLSIKRIVRGKNLHANESIFLCDLYENEPDLNPKPEPMRFHNICGALFVVSNRCVSDLFKEAGKSTVPEAITQHLVSILSEEEALACAMAMYRLEKDTCRFAKQNDAILNEKQALNVFQARMKELGPNLRYIDTTEKQYKEYLGKLPTLADGAIHDSQTVISLYETPKNSGKFYAATFKDGVIKSEITTYREAVSDEYYERHKDDFDKNGFKVVWGSPNWQWKHMSTLSLNLLAKVAVRNSATMGVLKTLGLDSAIHEYVSKSLLNFREIDQEVADAFNWIDWEFCIDLGAGTIISTETILDEAEVAQVLSMLQCCTTEQTFREDEFNLTADEMKEHVLYTALFTRHPLFERVYKTGKLIIWMQESRSLPIAHAANASTVDRAFKRLGIKDTGSDDYKVLFVYVTDYSADNMFDGLHFKFKKTPSSNFTTGGNMGLMEWRRYYYNLMNSSVSSTSVRPPTLSPVSSSQQAAPYPPSINSSASSLTSNGPSELPSTPDNLTNFIDESSAAATKFLTLIVRAGFYPGVLKNSLIAVSSIDFAANRLKSSLTRIIGKPPSNTTKAFLASEMEMLIQDEKKRVLETLRTAADLKI